MQDVGFTRLVKFVLLRLAMPDRKHSADACFPELHNVVYSHVENLFQMLYPLASQQIFGRQVLARLALGFTVLEGLD